MKVKEAESNETGVAKKSKIISKIKKDIEKNKKTIQKDVSPDEITKKKEKKKKHKKEKKEPTSNGNDKDPEGVELDEKALAKIEKKKAKKLAKKLKLKEKKEKGQLETSQTSNQESEEEEEPKQKIGKKKDKKKKPEPEAEDLPEPTQENTNKKEKKKSESEAEDGKESTQQNGKKKEKKKKPKRDVEDKKERVKGDPSSTVFVGNLPVSTKRVQIMKLFKKYGGVKSIRLRTASGQVLFKHKQRKQAGSLNAYVVLKDAEAAKKALELNGLEFKDSHLRITPAETQKACEKDDVKRTLFVGNLKHSANENKLREIFSNCGEIDYIRCLMDGKNGCKGVAFVCFKSPEAIGLALELNETLLDERPIHVERYSPKKLGAKEARDKQSAVTQKPKPTGANKRIKDKQHQKKGGLAKPFEKKKKTDFHGVKASGIKKQKNTKKPNNEMKGLAKKIAPKAKKGE